MNNGINNIWKFIWSYIKRPIKTFNVENRARKIISQSKATPAPQHESTQRQVEIARTINPDFMEKHYIKDDQLNNRLKEVYVSSSDPIGAGMTDDVTKSSDDVSPQRASSQQFEYGAYEPMIIPEGKATLKQILNFICQHENDPVTFNSSQIATKLKLDEKAVDNILKHHRLYQLYIPKEKEKDSVMSEWKRMWKEDMKLLHSK